MVRTSKFLHAPNEVEFGCPAVSISIPDVRNFLGHIKKNLVDFLLRRLSALFLVDGRYICARFVRSTDTVVTRATRLFLASPEQLGSSRLV